MGAVPGVGGGLRGGDENLGVKQWFSTLRHIYNHLENFSKKKKKRKERKQGLGLTPQGYLLNWSDWAQIFFNFPGGSNVQLR